MMLAELYPQYDVTWAIPSKRILSSVLAKPQTELYRDNLDCVFHSFIVHGWEANQKGFEGFTNKLRRLGESQSHVYCDFRYGRERGANEKYRAMLTFKPEIETAAREKIRTQFGTDYSVLHVRTGDTELRHGKPIDLARWVNAIQDYLFGATAPIVLVCDSISLKNQMSRQLLCTPGSPYHSGNDEGNVESFVFDVLTIQNAKNVHTIMANAWSGSSFSRIPAQFAGIPTTHYNILW